MHVRIARFEGASASAIDEQAAMIRSSLAAARAGQVPEGIPPEAFEVLRNDVARVLEIADRSNGVIVDLTFADSAEALQRVHRVLDQMSPGEGGGSRVSVQLCEVTVDEQMK